MNHRLVRVLGVTLLMVTLMLVRSDILVAYADCGNTSVDLGGVDCDLDGNTSGDNGEDGGSSNNEDDGDSGNTNNNGNNTNNNNTGVACTPGTYVSTNVAFQAGSSGIAVPGGNFDPYDVPYSLPDGSVVDSSGIPGDLCATGSMLVDSCTGESLGAPGFSTVNGSIPLSSCPTNNNTSYDHPCDEFIVSGSGVTCNSDLDDSNNSNSPGSTFSVSAHADWPGNEIHTRPYPVTLVDWDSVLRVAGLGTSSGSGRLNYAPWGGGSENNPAAGDWKDVVLRLEIRPLADWADVFLENIGLLRLQIGHLYTFQWNLPSHPAAGGGPLSGQVGQLEELEPDVPLYSNWSRAPYMVYCTLEYYEWDSVCVGGPDDYGNTNCRRDSNDVFTGHREWGWYRRSQTVPVPPTAARVDAPASLLADLNGDGVPDAYWGRLSFIRRMDDAGSVTNPEWAHSYSWGAWWYWAVREAQGQIGWPGVPVDQ